MIIDRNDMVNVKIISDGTPSGTKVLLEDGTQIKGVTALRLTIEAGKIPKAELDIVPYSVEVQAQLDSINVRKFNE